VQKAVYEAAVSQLPQAAGTTLQRLQNAVSLLKFRRDSVAFGLATDLYWQAKQLRYWMLTDQSDLVSIPDAPNSVDFRGSVVSINKAYQTAQRELGKAASSAWVAYSLDNETSPELLRSILAYSKGDSRAIAVELAPPTVASYYRLTYDEVRVLLVPPPSTPVRLRLTKGPSSTFFDSSGRRRLTFTHDEIPIRTGFDSNCRTLTTVERTDAYVQYSPYGSWRVEVEGDTSWLAKITELRFIFHVKFYNVLQRDSPTEVMFAEGMARFLPESFVAQSSSQSGGIVVPFCRYFVHLAMSSSRMHCSNLALRMPSTAG
jgi:hypothetical protein